MLTFLLSFNSWYDNSFDGRGHKRQVNVALGNLLQLYYPEVVVTGASRSVPVTGWYDYALALDARYKKSQGAVRNALWVSSYIFITSVSFTIYNLCTNHQMFDIVEMFSCE
jgi:hypothetical protein